MGKLTGRLSLEERGRLPFLLEPDYILTAYIGKSKLNSKPNPFKKIA